jgi:Fic family protein
MPEPTNNTKVERLGEKVFELTVIMNRVEELIDKLSEINSNLIILVNTHSNKIENITSILAQERLNAQAALDRIEKKMDKLETVSTKDFDDLKREFEKNFVRKENFEPLQKIMYGMVALTLTAIGGAVLNLIMK